MAKVVGEREHRGLPSGYTASEGGPLVPVSALRRLVRGRGAPAAALEHCDLCGAALPTTHRHLLHRSTRAITCACTACALLFERDGAGGGQYAAIPTRTLVLTAFRMTDVQWDELLIPVDMAFIVRDSAAGRAVASYPGPAGVTESLLELDNWQSLAAANPILTQLAPDVEALLINRVAEAREHYLVPIDACYELAGRIRTTWHGLSGGTEAWQAIDGFFADLRARAQSAPAEGGV